MASEAQTLGTSDNGTTDEGVHVIAVLIAAIAAVGGIVALILKTNIGGLGQKLLSLPGAMMGGMMEHMPDE